MRRSTRSAPRQQATLRTISSTTQALAPHSMRSRPNSNDSTAMSSSGVVAVLRVMISFSPSPHQVRFCQIDEFCAAAIMYRFDRVKTETSHLFNGDCRWHREFLAIDDDCSQGVNEHIGDFFGGHSFISFVANGTVS